MANRNWSRATLLSRLLEAVTEDGLVQASYSGTDLLNEPELADEISLGAVIAQLKTDIVRETMGERLG